MGVVALFGDMTYEGARGLVGPYLAMLGASATAVGFVAGLGEFLGYALRIATGWLSDRTRAYWPIVIAGYAVNFIAVPGLALAGSWEVAAALVILERAGKALRSPAKSTLLSFAATHVGYGKTFGIEEALDQIGAVSGPLLTALVIWGAQAQPIDQRYRLAFAFLMLPVLLNLGLVLFAKRKFPKPESFAPIEETPSAPLGSTYGWYIAAVMLLGLGFADWALVAYHANRAGLIGAATLPLLYAGVMAVDAVAALGFGTLFDRFGVRVLAVSSVVSAACAPLVFLQPSLGVLIAGALCWAVGLGAQESIFKAAIAQFVPKAQRARAYGGFFGLFGLAWWIGSTLMGWMYERSLSGLVAFSAITQVAAVPLLLIVDRRVRERHAAA